MSFNTTTDPLQFWQAAEYFLTRIPITKGWYEELGLKWRRYTFTIAGLAQLQMVADAQASLHTAILEGQHLREWKKAYLATLESQWAGSVANPGFRASTIWRNAAQRAYTTGRWRAMTDETVLQLRPYWLFDAIIDGRETDICRERDGLIVHHSDPWWDSNYPPLHHRCRSGVRSLSEAQAKARGITKAPVVGTRHQRGFGAAPTEEDWELDTTGFPQKLQTAWAAKLAAMTPLKPPLAPPPPKPGVPYSPATTPAPVTQPPLITPPKPPRPPRTPVTPPSSPPPLRDNVLATRLAGPSGSNPGGVYRGADGVTRYVKEYTDPAQAYGEHIANQLYRALGHDVPDSIVFQLADGRLAYASTMLENTQTLGSVRLTSARARKALDGFAADVLTGNWDAAGLNLDNMLLQGRKIVRVDNGGTFLMRARNGRKPAHLLDLITEWDAFANPSMNPAYARLFGAAGVYDARDLGQALITQIDKILDLEQAAGGWGAFVRLHAPGLNVADRNAIIRMLEQRTLLLATKQAEVRAHLQTAAALAASGHVQLEWGTGPFRHVTDQLATHKGAQALTQRAQSAQASWPAAAASARRSANQWTAGYSSSGYQAQLRAASEAVMAGRQPPKGWEWVAEVIGTRQARWDAAAKELGIPRPTSFRARRGVTGSAYLEDVYQAWKAGDTEMNVRAHTMASWSIRTPFNKDVIFDIDLPFEFTYADQILDDSTFVTSFLREHEVISLTPQPNQLVQQTNRVTVRYNGRTYTYADRHAFITAWEAARP